jgi:T5orf172 domain
MILSIKMTITSDFPKFLDNNEIKKLSNTYRKRAIREIMSAFHTDEDKAFLKTFFHYLNYEEDFKIDLDTIWPLIGFNKKAKAKEILEKKFRLDIDYKIPEHVAGTTLRQHFFMTLNTFRNLCLKANTNQTNKIYDNFNKIERILKKIKDEELSELQESSQFFTEDDESKVEDDATTVNIVQLIEKNPLSDLSSTYQNKLINKIKQKFTNDEQKMFITSFYCYLKYKKDEFVVDLDDVWEWMGFSKKDKAKDLLEKNFEPNVHFEVLLPEEREQKNKAGKRGGFNKEKILMTVKTFKRMCLLAGTKKSQEIHEYYINLEEILHETINEETAELRKEIMYNKIKMENQHLQIHRLTKEVERKEKKNYEAFRCVYILTNPSIPGHIKPGKATKGLNSRLENYISGAPLGYVVEHYRPVYSKREETAVESFLLAALGKYRVKNEHVKGQDREWLHTVSLDVVKKELDIIADFLEQRKAVHDKKFQDLLSKRKNKTEVLDIEDENDDDEVEECVETDDEDNEEPDVVVESEPNKTDELTIGVESESNNTDEPAFEPESNNNDDEIEDEDAPEVINNPVDFEKFLEECCIVDKSNKEYFALKCELREIHFAWCKSRTRDVKKQFDKFIDTNFKSSKIFVGDQRRHVCRGVKIKEIEYTPSGKNLDYEQFIQEKCQVSYKNRISYIDFFHFFTEWKQESDPDYKLSSEERLTIKENLKTQFCNARVLNTVSKNVSKNLFGIIGVGMEENNFGRVEGKRHNKQVGQYDIATNELLETFDSISLASHKIGIKFSTLGTHIRNKTVTNGKYYKLLE